MASQKTVIDSAVAALVATHKVCVLLATQRRAKGYNERHWLRFAARPLGVPAQPGEKYPYVEYFNAIPEASRQASSFG